jgi:membrane associated rhomboid family serine protease
LPGKYRVEKRPHSNYFHVEMLENRDYMRAPEPGLPFRFRWTASTILMVSLVVIFALQCINAVYLGTPAELWLGLTGAGLKSGFLWQLLTFQFLHGGLLHLLLNLLGLFYFGRFAEHVLGTRRFLVAYFGAGIVGGLLQGVLMIAFPTHFGGILFGASAGIAGMFALFAMLERDSTVHVYFVLPVRAMTLLMVFCAISLFFTLVPSPRDGTAHAAHLGGLLAGIAWVKLGWHRDFVTLPWEGLFSRWRSWRPLESRQRKHELVRAAKVRTESWKRAAPESPAELPPEEFISKEVDPILDKISQHGLHSLTDRERKILEAARKKMSRS